MYDQRLAKLADVLVNYSTDVKAGDKVSIKAEDVAIDFIRAVARAAIKKGAFVDYSVTVPEVEESTGSSTMFLGWYFFIVSTTAFMTSISGNIPIFTASGKISSKTASSCFFTNSPLIGIIPLIPTVFCAVRAVITLIPYIPWASIVFRSAWIPAPPLQSLPAIVKIFFIAPHFSASSRYKYH